MIFPFSSYLHRVLLKDYLAVGIRSTVLFNQKHINLGQKILPLADTMPARPHRYFSHILKFLVESFQPAC